MIYLFCSVLLHVAILLPSWFTQSARANRGLPPWVELQPIGLSSRSVGRGVYGLSIRTVVRQGNQMPIYPKEAAENGWSGEVRIQLELSKAGKVERTLLVQSTGYDCLDKAALLSAEKWQLPGYAGQTVQVPIQFVLND